MMRYSLYKDMHFVWPGILTMVAKDPLKLNNPISSCVISLMSGCMFLSCQGHVLEYIYTL